MLRRSEHSLLSYLLSESFLLVRVTLAVAATVRGIIATINQGAKGRKSERKTDMRLGREKKTKKKARILKKWPKKRPFLPRATLYGFGSQLCHSSLHDVNKSL